MTWTNAAFTIQDAIIRGQDVWDLFLTNWGNQTAPSADGTSLVFPAQGAAGLPSVFAIGIGQLSNIDRCVVQWNLQKLVPDTANWDFPRRVYCRAPLTFSQIGDQRTIVGTIPGNTNPTGSLSIYPIDSNSAPTGQSDGTLYANGYTKVDGTSATFGTSVVAPATFIVPMLHLQFYLRAPSVPVPTTRVPFFLSTTSPTDNAGTGVETLAFLVPVHGRRRVVVYLRNDQGPITYRVGVLNQVLVERTAATMAGVAAGVVASAVIEPILGDYLSIYYSVAAPARVRMQVIAED